MTTKKAKKDFLYTTKHTSYQSYFLDCSAAAPIQVFIALCNLLQYLTHYSLGLFDITLYRPVAITLHVQSTTTNFDVICEISV